MNRLLMTSLFSLPLCFGCGGPLLTEIKIPSQAVQAGLDVWLPLELTDYVDEEIPATVSLTSAEIIASDGTDRLGVQMQVDVALLAIDRDKALAAIKGKINEKLEENPPLVPVPPAPKLPEPVSKTQTDPASDAPSTTNNEPQIVERIHGEIIARVGIRYEAETTSFYCHNASAEKIRFDRLPPELEPGVERVCEAALNKYFDENAVYKIEGNDSALDLARSRLKQVTIRDGELFVTIGI